MTKTSWGLTSAMAMVLALAGCNKGNETSTTAEQNAALPALPQAVPMTAGPATAPASAPSASALPPAQPVQVAKVAQPTDAYAYIDRATALSDTFGDAPPDYAFDYDGVSPWAWQASDGDTQFAEPVDGGYRYYYYQPGEDYPYLVRDPSYSYAYDGPNLVAVYTAAGALLSAAAYREHLDAASRYRMRAAELYRASHDRPHRGVVGANWAARRSEIVAARTRWTQARVQQPDWVAYHQSHQAEEQQHWTQERARRAAAAQHFDDWHKRDFQGPPPGAGAAHRKPDGHGDRAPDRGQPGWDRDHQGPEHGRPDHGDRDRRDGDQHAAPPSADQRAQPGWDHRDNGPNRGQDEAARPSAPAHPAQPQTPPDRGHDAPGDHGRTETPKHPAPPPAHAAEPAEHARPAPPVAVHREAPPPAPQHDDHARTSAPATSHHETTPRPQPEHPAAHPPAASHSAAPHPAAPHGNQHDDHDRHH